ncbi:MULTISPECIES: class I SAM-dependent methyltransferase [unclassified Mesorhizobium]|uniref:class I SAM-dependent DNA methyltransferase n=1 Tax=unclassified Mesorhizobium TaxID=325217 RepID=UPI000F74D860|nr:MULTISPECIES: class I SAM-dependent methyltransferase [unclassified Mesorhizobium]AZO04938.1 class I SAM-dependent methyltransferase [Mesorhizobium sp. M2A.F.Ca.ET.043.02.1.1]RUW35037.1 class I SAM-dependent methyltransferase [Mesorhizobium sp. M2A.F.Ca.ET.015.02.1.1]RUW79894.1 class I SAM-dependent methyltransferase [Mesorhizobium sp. M2A.F.Ca.ET.067.02.1.1]RVC97640.1 class I SAM-dependent methyltransferase [Mesorhizobium sp. M2A.F.Ca.ET.017.03.2.1]RVD08759.1 class I SAM-dependent methyltr
MTDGKHSGSLSAAYAAKRPEDVAAIYDHWSETYDADMSAAGYRHPTICLALLARHLPRGAEPLLDAGAGTGLIGEWLAITGYPRVEALDISQGMLDKAGAKGVYTALHRLAMGDTLPFADGAYAGIISAGVFTSGHVGVEGLDELIRICRPGGVIVLTVKNTLWDAGFEERIAGLEARGTLSRLEETRPYASMPGETDTVPSRGLVLRVN